MRAAAFEKRLDKVVAFDIFYSFFDALRIRMPNDQITKIEQLLAAKDAKTVNLMFKSMMANNLDLNWKINKGMANVGVQSPYELLKQFQKYNMEPIMPLINQDVLLLAGENDQYVPSSRLVEIDSKLINLSLIHISEPTRRLMASRMPSSA